MFAAIQVAADIATQGHPRYKRDNVYAHVYPNGRARLFVRDGKVAWQLASLRHDKDDAEYIQITAMNAMGNIETGYVVNGIRFGEWTTYRDDFTTVVAKRRYAELEF